jgi:hypothetical protein
VSDRSSEARSDRSVKSNGSQASGQFVKTLARVLGVQVITLVLLWLLQSYFSR